MARAMHVIVKVNWAKRIKKFRERITSFRRSFLLPYLPSPVFPYIFQNFTMYSTKMRCFSSTPPENLIEQFFRLNAATAQMAPNPPEHAQMFELPRLLSFH
jgi:hypothetical protein